MSKKKKYEFTGETMDFEGHLLRRIRYIKYVNIVAEKGELGGWIESEHNLSHDGISCILDDAKVFGNARVYGSARVMQDAIVKDNAQIKESAVIFGDAIVGADTTVSSNARIEGLAKVFFYAHVLDGNDSESNVCENTLISGLAKIEATGWIKNSILRNKTFSGHLKLENFRN